MVEFRTWHLRHLLGTPSEPEGWRTTGTNRRGATIHAARVVAHSEDAHLELLKHYCDRLSRWMTFNPTDQISPMCRCKIPSEETFGYLFEQLILPAALNTELEIRAPGPVAATRGRGNHITLSLPFSYVGADADAANAQRRRSHPVRGNLRPVQIHCHEVGEDEGRNLVTDLSRQNRKG